MLDDPTRAGILVGLFAVAVSLALHARKQVPPKLNNIAVLLLASVGGMVGLDFGYTVTTASAQYLGPLERHRLAMILGAIAVVWVSVETVIDLYVKSAKASSDGRLADNSLRGEKDE